MANDLIAGRYRLLEPLGRGAMSAVWLAEDEELGRRVALKTLAPSAERERFEREARAAAALSHPNICSLYDYGEADGRPFMVLEYLPNGSLEDRLKGEPLADEDTQRIATEIAAGLAHAHERGLVHRDLKPANILFDAEGRAKIADFGIARMGGTGTLTEAGTVLGTASYISPEQAAGRQAGPASDVYSFGVILFRMLTGALPFVSTNAMELVRMHRDETPPAVADVRPDAPARLEAVAAASLAKDPADRPTNGNALLAELRGEEPTAATMLAAPAAAEATQVLPAAGPASAAAAASSSRSRRVALALAAVAALAVAGVAAALALTHTGGGDGSTPPPVSVPSLSLPNVSTARSTTEPTTPYIPTTEPTTTEPTTTTAPTTTAHTTTAHTTTHETTTAPTTTAAPTTTYVPPTTTYVPPTTTYETTTADTTPTTTAFGTTTTAP